MTRRAVHPALRMVGLGKTTVKGNLRNLGGLHVLCRRYDRNCLPERSGDGEKRRGDGPSPPSSLLPLSSSQRVTATRGGGTASRRRPARRRPDPAPRVGAASGTGT